MCLFSASGSTAERCTESAAGGAYSFQGLPDGSYQVGFALAPEEIGSGEPTAEGSGFQPQYYNDVATRSAAESILVIAPEITGGIDAALTVPATPAPPPLTPFVPSPVAAAPLAAAEPKQKEAGCKKGYRRKKVKRKTRCVKTEKKKAGKAKTIRHRHSRRKRRQNPKQ